MVRANPAELPLNRRAKGRQAESEDAIRGGGREAADGAARYGAGGNWDDTREHDCKTTVSFLPPTGGDLQFPLLRTKFQRVQGHQLRLFIALQVLCLRL
jgi:hypothetical protein